MGGLAVNEFGYGNARTKPPYQYKLCGLDDIYLRSGYKRTKTGYGDGVVIENIPSLHRAIGLHLVESKKTLNGKEVRFLRHEMNKTQAELADDMRVSDQSVARWEKGECNLSGPGDLVIRLFYLRHLGMLRQDDFFPMLASLRAMDERPVRKQVFAPTARGGGWEAVAPC
jgi:putative transcriptional regulator